MQEKSWFSDESYSTFEHSSENAFDPAHPPQDESPMPTGGDDPFQRGQAGRRRKAAVTLTLVWSSTVALHLVPGGSWIVLCFTAMIGIHILRIFRARPVFPPPPLMSEDADLYPHISLLVAAKNEESVISSLVQNLCTLDYPANRYDVWLIDDNSTDNTPTILARLAQEYEQLNVIRRPENATGGKSGALNQVWPITQGDIIAVFDADAKVPHDLLRHIVPLFKQDQVGAVQVRKAIANAPVNFWTRNQQVEMILDAYFQQQRIAIGGIGELRGNGQFVRREALQDCNGWNEQTITDDLDLTLRLHLNHWDIDFLSCPAVQEEGVTGAVGLWHQRNRWAEGGYQRYLDYWRLILRNRLGFRKSFDLAMFYFTQYIIPTATVPDVLMAIARSRMPILSPITSLTLLMSVVGMFVGLRRVRAQQRARKAGLPRSPQPLVQSLLSDAEMLFQSLRGTVYMLHWVLVIASTVIRISIRPKRLKWVKTVHYGALPSSDEAYLDVPEGL